MLAVLRLILGTMSSIAGLLIACLFYVAVNEAVKYVGFPLILKEYEHLQQYVMGSVPFIGSVIFVWQTLKVFSNKKTRMFLSSPVAIRTYANANSTGIAKEDIAEMKKYGSSDFLLCDLEGIRAHLDLKEVNDSLYCRPYSKGERLAVHWEALSKYEEKIARKMYLIPKRK